METEHTALVSSLDAIDPVLTVSLDAMAIQLPALDAEHPNRWPFSGVLTRLDEPSDRPPNGSHGHRVLIPAAVAEQCLGTLIGMAVDMAPDLADHAPQQKIGIITGATIQGKNLVVEGILYQQDFPREVAAIRARSQRGELGMSFEVTRARVDDPTAAIWVVRDLIFTGAAILTRGSAAYHQTALAARAEEAPMPSALTSATLSATLAATTDLALVSASSATVSAVLSAVHLAATTEADAALGARLVLALKEQAGVSAVSSFADLLTLTAQTFTSSAVDTAAAAPVVLAAAKASKEEAMRRAMSACLRAMQHFMGDDSAEEPLDPEHEDEAQDLAMLKKLVQKFAGRGPAATTTASAQKGATVDTSDKEAILSAIAALGVRLSAMEAAQGGALLTDTPASISGTLATEGAQKKDGLATDMPVRRTTMAAAHDPQAFASGQAFLAKYRLDASQDYSDEDLNQALAAVRDPQQRLAVKMEFESLRRARSAA